MRERLLKREDGGELLLSNHGRGCLMSRSELLPATKGRAAWGSSQQTGTRRNEAKGIEMRERAISTGELEPLRMSVVASKTSLASIPCQLTGMPC